MSISNKEITYLDLFAGAGGLSEGFFGRVNSRLPM